MAGQTKVCYRHPERTAKRRCYSCRQPVCPSCQVPLDHHIFCGEECHQQWLQKQEKQKARRAAQPAIKPAPRAVVDIAQVETHAAEARPAETKTGLVREEIERLAWSVEVLRGQLETLERDHQKAEQRLRDHEEQSRSRLRKPLLSVLIVSLLLGMGYWVRAMIVAPGTKAPVEAPAPSVYDLEVPASLMEDPWRGEPPDLEFPATGRKIQDSRITLFGSAPGAKEVHLLRNGELAAVASVEQGEFSFPDVALDKGINALQVEAVDEAGRKSYSLARFLERISRRVAKVPALQGLNFLRGPRERRELVLSFDAGASARQAETILDVLQAQGITTTIFLTGQFIERHPELVRRIVADGHEVGNHTYSHLHLTTFDQNQRHHTAAGVDRESFQAELRRTAKLFEQVTGQAMAGWWRAPYGEHNPELRRWAEEIGFKHVDWTHGPGGKNFDMLDWVADPRSRHYLNAEQLRERLIGLDNGRAGAANGGIVLMHLGSDRSQDFPASVLPDAIAELRAKGYRFVTVSQLFRE